MKETYAFITQPDEGHGVQGGLRVPGRVHVQGRAREGAAATPTTRSRSRSHEMDRWGIEKGLIGVGDEGGTGELALKRHPDRFIAVRPAPTRTTGMEAIRKIVRELRGRTACGPSACSRRAPSRRSPINDKKMYPIYAKCVELGIPVFCCAGVPGPAAADGAAAGRADRRGHVRLPRADLRHPPRLRAVDGPRGEADAQVAGPALLDERVRAEVLPEGDHRLRQHPRRRQDHLRRLLPDGPLARADHDRDAERRRSRTRCGRSSSARTPSGSSAAAPSTSPSATKAPRRRPTTLVAETQ